MNAEYVSELLSYNPDTGVFTWKPRLNNPQFNGHFVGRQAGKVTADGRVSITIDRRNYYAHRLAWLVVHGEWPPGNLDHVDRDPSNNRIGNLRVASVSENAANAPRRRDNRSGYKGVYEQVAGRFRAQIKHLYKWIHLGTFDTAEEAHAAYCGAAKVLFGKFACRG